MDWHEPGTWQKIIYFYFLGYMFERFKDGGFCKSISFSGLIPTLLEMF